MRLKNFVLKSFFVVLGLGLTVGLTAGLTAGCANRNKADLVETQLESQSAINQTQGQSVGVRDKEFVLQRKKNLNEELRQLQNQVHEMEDRVYGTREYKTFGLWGKLRDCRDKLKEPSSDFDAGPVEHPSDSDYLLNWKQNSGAKAGIEKSSGKLIAMSEEDLDDHIKKMNKTKAHLQEKEDEISAKLSRCQALSH